jgi:BON domain
VLILRPGSRANRAVRHRIDVLTGPLRDVVGRLHGLGYRLRRCHPNPDVPDLVLADRIRSSLGPLERRLDLPRVHVMVTDHVALLHGDVGTQKDADDIQTAVAAVSGVRAVESHLHIGLIAAHLPIDVRVMVVPARRARRQRRVRTSSELIDHVVAATPQLPRELARKVTSTVHAELRDVERDEAADIAAVLPAELRELWEHAPQTRLG